MDGKPRNVQVIDAALNCTYSIFGASEEDYLEIFPDERDVEFIDDFVERVGETRAGEICDRLWESPVAKPAVQGIHGTLFYELDHKKKYYPSKTDSEMVVVLPD